MDQFADELAICDVGALPYIWDFAQAVSCQRLCDGTAWGWCEEARRYQVSEVERKNEAL